MLYYGLNFQNGMSPVMKEMKNFHDFLLIMLILVASLVGVSLVSLYLNEGLSTSIYHKDSLEVAWTLGPALILLVLATPSLVLLYYLDFNLNKNEECMPVKVVGHQWYWHYEYNMKEEEMSKDSYMLPEKECKLGDFRVLETDLNLVLPCKKNIRFLVTSNDVLHSFALPSLGLKIDAVPGRLNQQVVQSLIVGKVYGQCSEICGANHSFMPMEVEFILKK